MINSISWMGRLALVVAVLCTGLICSPSLGCADDKDSNPTENANPVTKGFLKEKRTTKKAANLNISRENEAAAVAFAEQNHPELAALLQNLKRNAPNDYQAALADLDRTVVKLAKLKETSPERYELQLTEWKNTSRIRLLAARMTVSNDLSVEGDLRTALHDRLELRLAAQRTERDRLQKRIDKLNQTIDEMSTNADAIIDTHVADLRKTISTNKGISRKSVNRSVGSDRSSEMDEKK